MLDVVGTLAWTYAVVKIFIFDFDVYIVQHFLPQARWIVDWRFLILLVLLALWAVVGRPKWFLVGVLYVAFFPFVVVFWKVPRLIFRGRSWIPVFGALDLGTNLVRDYRFALFGLAAAFVSAAIILFASWPWLLLTAGGVWALLLLLLITRALWRSVNPSRFIKGQTALLDKMMASGWFSGLWQIQDELRSPAVSKFTETQQSTFITHMAFGVLGHRVMYWWAYQLDCYRRSSAPFLFNLLTYFRLFVVAVIGFALINAAVFRADPTAFVSSQTPGAFDFIHYSINILTAGPVELTPRSGLALAVADAARFTGIVVLITFVATVLFTERLSKQDEALRDSVGIFRRRAKEFDERFAEQYELSVAEAWDRLKELGYGLLGLIAYFSSRVPHDFEDE